MNATDLIVKYAKSNLNPTDYDKAIKTLNKKRPEQRRYFFSCYTGEIILKAVENGYCPIKGNQDFFFEKDGLTFSIGIKTQTEFNFAIFLMQFFKED